MPLADELERRITTGPLDTIPTDDEIEELRAYRYDDEIVATIARLRALRAVRLASGV